MVHSLFSLSQIRLTAAEILAVAVTEYVKNSYKISGGEFPWGFYYDFIFINPFSKEMLPLIEERMYQIAAKNFTIQLHEMLPKNSAEYLRCHGHFYGAHFAEISPTPLVQIFQMEGFVDKVQGQPLPTSKALKAFALLGTSQRPDLIFRKNRKKVVRIYGTAFRDKKEFRAFAGKKNVFFETNHLALGQKLGFFTLQFVRSLDYYEQVLVTWRGEGEQILYNLKTLWRRLHLKEGFELLQTTGKDISKAHQDFYHRFHFADQPFCVAEMRPPFSTDGLLDPIRGFFDAKYTHKDYVHIFCLEKHLVKKITSSLQFLERILSIFQLDGKCIIPPINKIEAEVKLGKKVKVQWMLQNSYGCFWKGPCLTIKRWDEEGIYLLHWNALFSLEQMVAFILEDMKKDLSQKKEFLSTIATLDE